MTDTTTGRSTNMDALIVLIAALAALIWVDVAAIPLDVRGSN
jgi:hypothetical protein